MASLEPLLVTFPGGRRVDVQVGAHTVHTDQPVSNGGEGTAPSPFDLFLASLGACAGIYVQGFCAARKLDPAGITIREVPAYGNDGVLWSVGLELSLPEDFPERYREPLLGVIDQCAVKKAIAAQPLITTRLSPAVKRAA